MKVLATQYLSDLQIGRIGESWYDPFINEDGRVISIKYEEFLLELLDMQDPSSPLYEDKSMTGLLENWQDKIEKSTEKELEEFVVLYKRYLEKIEFMAHLKEKYQQFEAGSNDLKSKRVTKKQKTKEN